MLRFVGISVYVLGLFIHYTWGSNATLYGWAFYFLCQNIAMSFICLGDIMNKMLWKRLIATCGFTYFASVSVFYILMAIERERLFFSESEVAGRVLAFLLIISVILTLIHHAYTPKRKRMDVYN